MFAPTPLTPPGQVTNVSATAGSGSASVSWSAPSSGGSPTSYTITPYIGSTAQTPTTVSGSTTSTTVSGLTAGTSLYVRRAGVQLRWRGLGVGAVERGHADGGECSVGAAGRVGESGHEPGARQLVGAEQQRRQPDHGLHDHALRGFDRAAPRSRSRRVGDERDGHRPDERDRVHVHGQGDQRGRDQPGVHAVVRGRPRRTRSSTSPATPADRRLRRRLVGRSSASSSPPTAAARSPASASTRRRRTRAPTSAACGPPSGQLLATATFTGETATGWQTVELLQPGRDHRRHDLRRRVLRPQRPLLRDLVRTERGGRQRAAARPRERHKRQRRLRLQRHQHVSRPTPTTPTTTGSTCCSRRDFDHAAGAADERVSGDARAARARPCRGRRRRAAAARSRATRSRRTSVRPRRPRRRSSGVDDDDTTVTGLTPGTTYTFVVTGVQRRWRRARRRRRRTRSRRRRRARPSAPQNVSASPATSQALVSWSAPSSNGGSSITGYTVTPYVGFDRADAGAGQQRLGDDRDGDGPDERDRLHVHGQGDQRVGTGPESTPRPRSTPQDTIFDFSGTPANVDSGDSSSVELGVKFTADISGSVTGIRFYKAAANTGTHIGSLWTTSGQLLAPGHVHERDRLGLADGRASPVRSRSPPARPTSPRTLPPTATTPRPRPDSTRRSTTRRCTPSRTAPAPTASTPTAPPARSRPAPTTPTTTGSTCCSRRPPTDAPGQPTNVSATAGCRRRIGDVDGAVERRQSDHELHGHAVHRLDGADADDGVGVDDEHDRHRVDSGTSPTRSSCRRRTRLAPARRRLRRTRSPRRRRVLRPRRRTWRRARPRARRLSAGRRRAATVAARSRATRSRRMSVRRRRRRSGRTTVRRRARR